MQPFEVVVTNLITQEEKARAGFPDKQQAETWLKKQLEVNMPWGMQKERWISQKPKGDHLDERQLEFDGQRHKQYLIPAEFEVEIVDNREELRKLEVKQRWEKLRNDRNEMLQNTDYMMLADAPVDREGKRDFIEYRQYLRDIPVLYQRGQIKDLCVMSLEQWKKNKPIYKREK